MDTIKNKKAIIVKIVIITLLIQGALIAFGWFAFSQNDQESQPGNQQQEEVAQTVAIENEEDTSQHMQSEEETLESVPQEAEPEPIVETPEPELPASNVTILNCGSDCTFAPVDKDHALPSSYNPGGLTADTQSAYSSLKSAAAADGILLQTISEFRSYNTQASTFEFWVQTEIGNGNSRTDAEQIANTYSARPGHSEHQLGTTIDIKCSGCSDWGADNQPAYDWIEANAHEYGFAISYPRDSEALTGYTYEPWHIRWIGIDLATELFETGYTSGNGNYLAQFLRDKGF